jgi:hypothetical protein
MISLAISTLLSGPNVIAGRLIQSRTRSCVRGGFLVMPSADRDADSTRLGLRALRNRDRQDDILERRVDLALDALQMAQPRARAFRASKSDPLDRARRAAQRRVEPVRPKITRGNGLVEELLALRPDADLRLLERGAVPHID